MGTNFSTTVTATWASGSPTSEPLDVPWAHCKGAVVSVSGAWTNAHIGLQIDVGFGFTPLRDWQGGFTGVSIPSASGLCLYEGPPSWFYAGGADAKVRLWSHNGTGTNVAQAAARTVLVQLKG